MRRTAFLLIVGLLLGVLTVTPSATAADRGVFVYATGTEPLTLDPAHGQDNNTGDMILAIHEGLVERAENGDVLPSLALEWKVSDNGKDWTFKLRTGVKFHDGTPFNAAAVKYNLDRILDPKTASPNRAPFSVIDKVRSAGELEVVISTKQPFGGMLDFLTGYNVTFASPAAMEKHGKDYGIHAAGTAPLMLNEWVRGVKFNLKRFDGYWGKKVGYDRLEYKVVPEENTRILLLLSGEADVIKGVSPNQVDRLRKESGVSVIQKPGPRLIMLQLNAGIEPLKDVRVRQAINYAIDKDGIIKNVLKGHAEPAVGVAAPVNTHASTKLTPEYKHDPALAKKLLAEAGYAKGFKTTLMTPEGRYPMDRTVAEVIQGQLKEVGIEAELKVLEWGTYTAIRNAKKETRLFLMGNGNPPLDLDFLLYKSFATTGSSNTSSYSNPEVDKLLEAQRVTVDPKTRREILLKAQQLIHQDSPWICLYYEYQNIGVRANVKGMRVNPNEQLYFTGLRRE